jgi:hypothetical protein
MRRLQDFLSEDSNQYGPGTDLIISLLAVLLVMIFISSHMNAQLVKERDAQLANGGSFKPGPKAFEAADFRKNPYWELSDRADALKKVREIMRAYRESQDTYRFIFVVGHASSADAEDAADRSPTARMIRNWGYAGGRAAVVSSLLQEFLNAPGEKDKLVVCSTGEFDLKAPKSDSDENAYVEVFFGKDWKPPVR